MFDGFIKRVCFMVNEDGKSHWMACCIDVENFKVYMGCPLGRKPRPSTKDAIAWFIQRHGRGHRDAYNQWDVVEESLSALISKENRERAWPDNPGLPRQPDGYSCAYWAIFFVMYFALGMVPFSDVGDRANLASWQESMEQWVRLVCITDGRVVLPHGWIVQDMSAGDDDEEDAWVFYPPAVTQTDSYLDSVRGYLAGQGTSVGGQVFDWNAVKLQHYEQWLEHRQVRKTRIGRCGPLPPLSYDEGTHASSGSGAVEDHGDE